MMILYLAEQDTYLTKKENRAFVSKSHNTLKEISLEKLDAVVLIGNTYITSPLIKELLEREIPLTWLSSTGKFFGRLEPTTGYNIERQRLQFMVSEDMEFRLALSKKFIKAKIKNNRTLLQKYNSTRNIGPVEESIDTLNFYVAKIDEADSIPQIMGFEGTSAKEYFKALGHFLPELFYFSKRTKQPPKDKFNALISLGYTLLLYEIYTTVLNKKLHPYIGIMHQPKKGHPALCSDLIEEWRPVIIDSLCLSMVIKRQIKEDHFREVYKEKTILPESMNELDAENSQDKEAPYIAVYCNDDGCKIFLEAFEKKLLTSNKYSEFVDYPVSYRESLQLQVNSLVKSIEECNPDYYKPVIYK